MTTFSVYERYSRSGIPQFVKRSQVRLWQVPNVVGWTKMEISRGKRRSSGKENASAINISRPCFACGSTASPKNWLRREKSPRNPFVFQPRAFLFVADKLTKNWDFGGKILFGNTEKNWGMRVSQRNASRPCGKLCDEIVRGCFLGNILIYYILCFG